MMIGGSHFLNALGVNSGMVLGRLERFEQQVQNLQTLALDFGATSGHMGPAALAQMLQMGGIPPAAHMSAPPWGHCACPGRYAMPRTFDFGAAPGHAPFSLPALFARHQGAKLERLLNQNPFARAQAEMMLGGRILPDGMADGRITVQPFAPGFFPAGGAGNLAAGHAMNALNQLQQAAYSAGFGAGMGAASGFNDMMLGGLANLLGMMSGAGAPGAGGAGAPGGGNVNPAFANGNNPFDPGGQIPAARNPNGGNIKWADPAGVRNGDVSAVLNDPSLTVEDQVVLMLMMIMKQMDKKIKAQADYVNKIQQQANEGEQGGDAPSIDVETMKLKRLVDKRSQMFDFLRQIVDKYNQTAKNMIDSIGR
jgi:hypothetical protein